MKIVQTFWTCNHSLLEHCFGWQNPQFHLMSWALSCLSLREHYEEVVLYTDTNGYRVFGELLKLPYTDIVVQYDNLPCPEQHWAYPKLLTYSLQEKPFLHVDGDVFLPYRLPQEIESAGLVAQNWEVSGKHYRGIADDILRRRLKLPDFLLSALHQEEIPSYNAGILGGNDLDFIHRYCQTAFQWIAANHLNEADCPNVSVNNNIFFEQILFAALAEKEGKKVASVFERPVRDDGYTYGCFCNFYHFDHTKVMHLIGRHKQNPRILEMLSKTLLDRYPEYYKRIVELFPQYHKRLQKGRHTLLLPNMGIQMCLARYEDHLCDLLSEWQHIGKDELYALERKMAVYPHFLNADVETQKKFIVGRNPYLSIFEIPDHWPPKAAQLLKERINAPRAGCADVKDITIIPCLLGEGYRELLISDLCYNILVLLEHECTFGELMEKLQPCFDEAIKNEDGRIYRMVMTEMEYLFFSGQVYVTSPENADKTVVQL